MRLSVKILQVHMNSLTVFSNWPKQDTPLARVTSVSFSPDSGFMVVGNVHGKALLFKLHHFYASSS
jgi:U3 small nucleolar RNA-associated protein 18